MEKTRLVNQKQNQETSPLSVKSLPIEWVDYIFSKMERRFGSQWVDKYAGIDRKLMLESWAEDLFDLTPEQLKKGLEDARHLTFPPNVGQFIELCRPKKECALNAAMYLPAVPQEKAKCSKRKEEIQAILDGFAKKLTEASGE